MLGTFSPSIPEYQPSMGFVSPLVIFQSHVLSVSISSTRSDSLRFACQVDPQKLEITFALSGNPYRFQFLPDRSKGIRSRSDETRQRLFSVKPKR